jgi:short-subunit dehydrogenase
MNVVLSSSKPDRLQAAAETLRTAGGNIVTVPCDVADRAAGRNLAAQAKASFGQVDLLCANAGATTFGRYEDHQDEDWDWSIDVNFRGVTNCIQTFYPDMVARGGGTLMLTGSQTALAPDWVLGHGPYVAAKGAVLALALALRAEAQQHNVAVSLLLPAATQSDIMQNARLVPPGTGTVSVNADVPAPDPAVSFISADEVAARAIAGLRDNRPIIATHASMRPAVEYYCSNLLAAYDAAARYAG